MCITAETASNIPHVVLLLKDLNHPHLQKTLNAMSKDDFCHNVLFFSIKYMFILKTVLKIVFLFSELFVVHVLHMITCYVSKMGPCSKSNAMSPVHE